MIDTTAAEVFDRLANQELELMEAWVATLDFDHAVALHGLITLRLAQLGVESISGSVEFP